MWVWLIHFRRNYLSAGNKMYCLWKTFKWRYSGNATIAKNSLPDAWKEENDEQTMTKQMPHMKPLTHKEELQQRKRHIWINRGASKNNATEKPSWESHSREIRNESEQPNKRLVFFIVSLDSFRTAWFFASFGLVGSTKLWPRNSVLSKLSYG